MWTAAKLHWPKGCFTARGCCASWGAWTTGTSFLTPTAGAGAGHHDLCQAGRADAAAALAHAVDFGHLDIVAMSDEAMVRILLANIVPWPPTPTKSTLFISDILFIPPFWKWPEPGRPACRPYSDAIRLSNIGFLRFTVIAQGRAAGGEAFLAANALIRIDDARRLVGG